MNLKNNYQKLKSTLGLSYSLAVANFKLRNEGNFLGIFWYLLDPLILFLIMIILRSYVAGGHDEKYPLYLLIGLVVFNFFRGATTGMVGAISENAGFIKSLNIHKESLIISKAAQFAFSHFFEMSVLVIFAIFLKGNLFGFLIYPFLFFFYFLFTLGLGFFLSIFGVWVKDMANVWNILTRFLWFGTPIFYVLRENTIIYKINLLNPIYYFIEITRNFILGNSASFIEPWALLVVVLISVCFFISGFLFFDKFKNRIAEQL